MINEEKIIAFENAANNLESGIDKIMEEGRDLRLGIVGEVKAGKSSFLNALIFDGEDILPKAPTPMTAALTKSATAKLRRQKYIFTIKMTGMLSLRITKRIMHGSTRCIISTELTLSEREARH